MSASKPSYEIKNQAADLFLFWQSIAQRGNRIIVIEEFFATTFSCYLSIKFRCKKSRFTITNSFPSTTQCKQFYCVRIDEWMNERKSTKQVLVDEDLARLILTNCSENCVASMFKKSFAVCLSQHFRADFDWSHN
jgi:hypothetical protein